MRPLFRHERGVARIELSTGPKRSNRLINQCTWPKEARITFDPRHASLTLIPKNPVFENRHSAALLYYLTITKQSQTKANRKQPRQPKQPWLVYEQPTFTTSMRQHQRQDQQTDTPRQQVNKTKFNCVKSIVASFLLGQIV